MNVGMKEVNLVVLSKTLRRNSYGVDYILNLKLTTRILPFYLGRSCS